MRHLSQLVCALALPTLAAGCGDDGSTSASATDTGTGNSGVTEPGTGTPTTSPVPTTGSSTQSVPTEGTVGESATGTSEASTVASATETATTDATSTGTPVTATVGTTDVPGTSTGVSSSTTGDPPAPVCGNGLIEAGEQCDDGDDIDDNACSNACQNVPCDQQIGGGGEFDFSFIWIANSPEGTVSKVDTVLQKEVARYRTDPLQGSSPSRTAVNVDGRFAAVANRIAGSVTVYAATEEDCVDKNNNGTIDTSTGPGDVKPWGQDECQLWNVKIEPSNNGNEQKGPRPLGWDFADLNPQTCKFETNTLWMGWYGNNNQAYFWHLDIQGNKLGEVIVPVWGNQNAWGPYGGAVDKNHDFWVTGWHGPLVRIDHTNYTYKMWNDPMLANTAAYGMALDKEGDPWFGGCGGSVVTFDAQNETFINVGSPGGCLRGLMVDGEGRGWIARNGGACLIQVDTENNTIVNQNINLPGCQTVVGVSIDIEGFVWVVDQGGWAFKVDPDTLQSQMVNGFNGPYTYSDMTGAGIRLQALPQ